MRRIALAAFTVAVVIRLAASIALGVRLGGDSPFYLSIAEGLRRSGPAALLSLDPSAAPLYPVLLAAAGLTGLPMTSAAVLLNALLGGLTAVLVVRIAYRIRPSRAVAALAGLLVAGHITLVFWSLYVLTETVFLFFLAFSVERLLVLTDTRRPFIHSVVSGVSILLVLLVRPTAAAFALLVPIYIVLATRRDPARLARCAVGLCLPVLAVIAAAVVSGRSAATWDLLVQRVWVSMWFGLQWTEEGRGTWGVDFTGGPPDGDFRGGTLRWLAADPMHFVLQAGRKLRALWAPTLPSFSVVHGAVSLAFYLPYYALSLYGIRSAGRSAGLALLWLGIVGFTALPAVTFVDYDQRYRLPAELLLAPLVAIGAHAVVVRIQRIRRSQR